MFIKTHQSVYRNIPLIVCKLYFNKTDFKVSALIKSLYLFIDHAVRLGGAQFSNLRQKPGVLTTGLSGKFQCHCIHMAFEMLFTHHKINPFEVYNSIFFKAHLQLCNHHHNEFPNFFITPLKKTHTHQQSVPTSLSDPPSPWQLLICFSLWLCLFQTFSKNRIT